MSRYTPVTNEQGLTCEIVHHTDDNKYETIMGGDNTNPSWDDFLSQFVPEFQPHILLIKKCIEENGLVGSKGGDCANYITFLFSDKTHIAFTWRGWGDLMQSIVNKNEGYMAYYM